MQESKTVDGFLFDRYRPITYSSEEMLQRGESFYDFMNLRRTVRDFSDRPVDKRIVDLAIQTASTAPSGAHKQPWTFCVISDAAIKKEIRIAAEAEEYESYHGRMSADWLEDLRPLQTDWHKPFLEIAPYLIVVFKKAYDILPDGTKKNNYYVNESVGLACGFLLAALHHAGLCALTHTPSPMAFLTKILNRPENERPFLLLPVGYAAEETFVPRLQRRKLKEVAVYY